MPSSIKTLFSIFFQLYKLLILKYLCKRNSIIYKNITLHYIYILQGYLLQETDIFYLRCIGGYFFQKNIILLFIYSRNSEARS